ncbi:Two component system, signal transduction histidine kinase [Acididesulfobacillus acetoxydans]|uniref:histidine kinase n=1 Tax=Acididesulfobacillus acetoxydans TaxID=1561005 RepID=A0A8S0XZY9_9FIRM|nr:ATP-binding protein [Acididesulfobacillus acetoxydans]CAA7602667.1 Two component system, signal transduction histidine kinase [Acididesulfobacillus acetoxydans]CEJ09140.1 Sensor histidine kinase ResE [Acididesulfobacillus acetoxydans]
MFKFNHPLSISIKLWLAMTLLILTVLGGLGLTITWLFTGFYFQQQLAALKAQATATASELAPLQSWNERFRAIQGTKLADGTQLVLLNASGATLAVMGTIYPSGVPAGTGWDGGLMWGRTLKPTDFFSTDNLLEVLAGNTLSIKALPVNGNGPAMLIAAAPIGHKPVTGVVLLGSSPVPVQQSIDTFRRLILYASLLAVALATLVSLFLARQMTRPLALMQKAASRMAQGDFEPIKGISGRDEMGELASALNSMSRSLNDHVTWLSQEKSLLEGIVRGISDAVIMLGSDGELLYANDPAKQLWQDDGEEGGGGRRELILEFLRGLIAEKREVAGPTTDLPAGESVPEPAKAAIKAGVPDDGEFTKAQNAPTRTEPAGEPAEARRSGEREVLAPTEPDRESTETEGSGRQNFPAEPESEDGAGVSRAAGGSSGIRDMPLPTLALGRQVLQVGMASLAESGGIRGHVIVLRDVSASMRAEKERREFLASVTHELRTPLHLIQGYLEAIQDGVIPKAEEAENIGLVLDESKRLARLVHRLQDISRLEREQALQFSILRLKEFMQELVPRFQGKAHDLGVRLYILPATGEIAADRDRLLQVFINLLDNALRHTGRGKTVEVGVEVFSGSVRFWVKDEGEGIPPEALAHIFERFYRVDKARSRKDGGMGLGLAIVKQIVEAHEGRVWVESQLGVGSTFWVEIPKRGDRSHK